MSDSDRKPVFDEAFERKPRSSKVMRSQSRVLLQKAEEEGLLEGDNTLDLIVKFARKTNVGAPELASYVIREAMRQNII